jgi:excisionase family DNA binding protein
VSEAASHTESATRRLATPKDVAAALDVHINTVYAMAQRGEIPIALHIGPRLRFDLDDVLTTLKQREKGTP